MKYTYDKTKPLTLSELKDRYYLSGKWQIGYPVIIVDTSDNFEIFAVLDEFKSCGLVAVWCAYDDDPIYTESNYGTEWLAYDIISED